MEAASPEEREVRAPMTLQAVLGHLQVYAAAAAPILAAAGSGRPFIGAKSPLL